MLEIKKNNDSNNFILVFLFLYMVLPIEQVQ